MLTGSMPSLQGPPSLPDPSQEHAVLIRKHLALVDETPHQGILYGLHLADVVAERKDRGRWTEVP